MFIFFYLFFISCNQFEDLIDLIEFDSQISKETLKYLKSKHTNEKEQGLYNLVSRLGDSIVHQLLYVDNAYRPYDIFRDPKSLCEMTIKIADKVVNQYLENRYFFKTRALFEELDEENEIINNFETIIQLACNRDNKSIREVISAVERGYIDPFKYYEQLNVLGKLGILSAYYILGELHLYGHGVKKDFTIAKKYFLIGANKNDPNGLCGMAQVLYYEGDYDLAKKYAQKAISFGSISANYLFYKISLKSESRGFVEMFYLSVAVKRGYLPAMYEHAKLLIEGKKYMDALSLLISIARFSLEMQNYYFISKKYFLEKNYRKALAYTYLGAEMGSTSMLNNSLFLLNRIKNEKLEFYLLMHNLYSGIYTKLPELGDCYFYGKGTKLDYEKAFGYYLSASIYKSIKGFYSLSYCYYSGKGCERNFLFSIKYLFRAIEFDADAYIYMVYLIPLYILGVFWRAFPKSEVIVSALVVVLMRLIRRCFIKL